MLRALHDANLAAALTSVRPIVGRAGSGLVFHDGRLYVIQDDANAIVIVDPSSGDSSRLPLEGKGEDEGGAIPKHEKPDFEAAFLAPDNILFVVGSGSAPRRRRIARVSLETRNVTVEDFSPFYDELEKTLGVTPNIEGALLLGDVFRLFHRGSGSGPSVIVDVNADILFSTAQTTKILKIMEVDLGLARGVPLHFTDAALIRDRVVYLAAAEDTPNAIDDGPIVGAAVGIFHEGEARQVLLHEASGEPSVRKWEGITFDPTRGIFYAVTDPDDIEKPAELGILELKGFFS